MDTNTISVLQNWIGLFNYSIIYDSHVDELSSRCINAKIMGKKNVTILVKTCCGSLFGSFHQNSVKNPPEQYYSRYIQEGGYFIFVTSRLSDYLMLYSNDNESSLIGNVKSGSTISTDFTFYYDSPYSGDFFVGKTAPNTFDLDHLLIIQWN
ncbi:TLDc domain-containing protein [Entamoeba marina]